ncbi:MAG: hypothetical protein HY866_12975 [Chloroflexi bacterium]|nr:hypothetical protein [Chloroflexota bacterium]
MFDPRYPWLAIGFLTLVATFGLLYHGAIVFGLYKDPLMSCFRWYGPEKRYYPLCRFLEMLAAWSLMVSSMLDSLTTNSRETWLYAPAMFFALSLLAFASSLIARKQTTLREALPFWYSELMGSTTRQERRQLAFAWLRIPLKMRWHLSGDQASFRVWVDMVRMTVFYGATDPASPWDRWN